MTSSLNEKNILYIVHSYNSFTKDQIESLAPYFKKVYVLVRYKPIAEISRFISFLSQYKYHQKKFAIDLNGKPSNVEVIAVSIFYLPGDFFYKKIGDRLFKKCLNVIRNKDIQFDLIHAHFAWSSGYVGIRIKKIFNKPLIITLHGEDIYDLPFRDEEWKLKITDILKNANFLINVGPKNKKALDDLGITTINEIIDNGYRSDLFFPSKINLNDSVNNILSIGSLDEIKGHIYLIKALKILKDNKVNFQCKIIGDGPEKIKLFNLIIKLNLKDNVILLGSKNHKDLNAFYNEAKVFVLPSLHESFGVVQIESLACGVPVVATINGGSEYIIKSEEIGILVEKKSPESLANGIQMAINKEWNKNNIIEYSKAFNLDNIVIKILRIYKNLI